MTPARGKLDWGLARVILVSILIVAFVAFVAFFIDLHLDDTNNNPNVNKYEVGTIAGIISAGMDPDGSYKIRISRGGADLQILSDKELLGVEGKNLRPGDQLVFCGIWYRVRSVVEVVDGNFNEFHKGDRIAFTSRGPVPVKYWNPNEK